MNTKMIHTCVLVITHYDYSMFSCIVCVFNVIVMNAHGGALSGELQYYGNTSCLNIRMDSYWNKPYHYPLRFQVNQFEIMF